MKLLVVVSSLDLTQPFSATPAWWQLLKALYEVGVEVVATTYQGPAIESLWWRALPNPVKLQGDIFKALRDAAKPVTQRPRPASQIDTRETGESFADKLQRDAAQRLIAPRWRAFMDRTLSAEPDIDAVMFLTTPLNHVVGLPAFIRQKFNKPVFYFDGDVPASLPAFAGFSTGFKIYQGADLGEYTAFFSNSLGGVDLLREMGARAAHCIYFGIDQDVYSPLDVPQDIDVFFFGHSREYREEWIDGMIAHASRALPDRRFAARGWGLGDLGRAQNLPYLSFNKLREYVCRSRINLCITRKAHTSVYASSSSRLFELASFGACIVANPYLGIEEWFEPGKDLIIVNSAEEAVERYRWLLGDDSARRALGESARARFLQSHTFRHRAAQLVDIIKGYL